MERFLFKFLKSIAKNIPTCAKKMRRDQCKK